MDINNIEQEEIRPLIFNYIFHFILFILIFALHLIIYFKIYWVSGILSLLFILGTFFGIIYFIFPTIPIFLIIFKKFKSKKVIIVFRRISLLLLILALILGFVVSIAVFINTINSKVFCQECPFNISLGHLNYIFMSYYGKSPSQDEIKDKCKSRRCVLDSVNLNEDYPYIYLCNYDPSSEFNDGNEIYKRTLPDGTEINTDNLLQCTPVGISYYDFNLDNNELYDYLDLCYYISEFYYCKRFNKPKKKYDLDLGATCPETSYLFLLYILCVLIIIIDIIISLLPWGVEFISLKRIIEILSSSRRKANSNNSTAKSSVISDNQDSFKKERTLVLVSPIYNNNNNNIINIINVQNKNNNIKSSQNPLIDNEDNKDEIKIRPRPLTIIENSDRIGLKKESENDNNIKNTNSIIISKINNNNNQIEENINTDFHNNNSNNLYIRDKMDLYNEKK